MRKNVSNRNEVDIEDPLAFISKPADKSENEEQSISTYVQTSLEKLNCGAVQSDELNYIVNEIRSSRLITSPFPHVFIENIYPTRVYKFMLANIP